MTAPVAPLPRALVVLLGTASAVIVVAGMRAAAWLIAPVLLALVIVIVISPVHRWLRRHGVPAWAATVALVTVVYGMLLAFVVVLIIAALRLATLLPQYTDRARDLATRGADLLGEWGISADQLAEFARSVDPSRILSSLGTLLGDVTSVTTGVVFLLALLLFFSFEAGGIDTRLTELAGDRPQVHRAFGEFARKTRRYLVVTTIFGLLVAVLDTLALLWLGIPVAILWGLLSFVTNYVPNVGFIIGVIPPVVVALLSAGWQRALTVIVVYVAINFVLQSVVQPRYVGDAVGLSATLTFVSLAFWAWVLGPLGVLLATPATLLVMAVLVDIDPRAGWAAAMLRAPDRHRGPEVLSPAGDARAARRGLR